MAIILQIANILKWASKTSIILKSNILSVHSTKVCSRCRGIALVILNLDRRWRWVINITPLSLYSQESTRYQLTAGCVGTRVRLDDFEKKENLCPLQEFETRIPQSVPVSILTKDTTVNWLPNISNYMTEKIRHLCGRKDTNTQPPTANFPRDEVKAERVDSVLF
jgi:hypothetical protein